MCQYSRDYITHIVYKLLPTLQLIVINKCNFTIIKMIHQIGIDTFMTVSVVLIGQFTVMSRTSYIRILLYALRMQNRIVIRISVSRTYDTIIRITYTKRSVFRTYDNMYYVYETRSYNRRDCTSQRLQDRRVSERCTVSMTETRTPLYRRLCTSCTENASSIRTRLSPRDYARL